MVMTLDTSSTGTPRPIVNAHYEPTTFWRLMESWAEFNLTHRRLRRPFSEGGSIAHRDIATEGNFCGGAEDFADLKLARRALTSPDEQMAVALYWEEGQRSVRRVGLAMHKDMNQAREWVWLGTERMIAQLCGLTWQEAHAEARLYRQRLPMRRLK